MSSCDYPGFVSQLIRLEITVWNQLDARLREADGVSLAIFQAMDALRREPGGALRVGDLAARLVITVGGASKLADRAVTTGLVAREPDPADRRASRLVLTPAGAERVSAAGATVDAWVGALLGHALAPEEEGLLVALVDRVLAAAVAAGSAGTSRH